MHRISHSYKRLGLLYLGAIFMAFHYYFIIYSNGTFMSQFVSEEVIGLLFVMGAVLTILFLYFLPKEFIHHGLFRTTVYLIIVEILALLGLAVSKSAGFILFFFVLHLAMPALLLYCLDIFLERESEQKNTGLIRALYLTSMNAALVVSPLVTGYLITSFSYHVVYTVSAFFLFPLFLVLYSFQKRSNIHVIPIELKTSLKSFHQDNDLLNAIGINFLLQFFYASMVVYVPIYLLNHLGFSWESLGLIFTVMLLPFLIFILPLGPLEDRKYGEKEVLIIGFLIMAVSTAAVTFLHSDKIWLWAALLFMTRVGASFVEISSDTYFFKKVQARDANLISFYRGMIPLSYIAAPLLISFCLWFIDLRYIFLIVGILMLYGVIISIQIKDTR